MRKVIQISTAMTKNSYGNIIGQTVALCDDNSIWQLELIEGGKEQYDVDWVRLKDIPQNEEEISKPVRMTGELRDIFNMRTINCLSSAGIYSMDDLLQKTELDLLKIPSLGKLTLKFIKEVLSSEGLSLKKAY
ncbi:DNA-directed RNA polymerase subunit alpha C-terminal domain-containing protein [Aggregatibacter segnis]|uniref:DNA-directed RNA polymerase subunit alpha C-terminal domain-containing protein n=1 Tax=Aggregatibacter segnis TaxID=739 RepID=UPI003FA189A8